MKQELTALYTLLETSNDEEILEGFKALCLSREQRNTNKAFSFFALPESICNKLYWELASHLFQTEDFKTLLGIVLPTLKFGYQIGINYCDLKAELQLKQVTFSKLIFDSKIETLSQLNQFVADNDSIFPINLVTRLDFNLHRQLRQHLIQKQPNLLAKLDKHNSDFGQLALDIDLVENTGTTPREALEKLKKAFILAGEKFSGSEKEAGLSGSYALNDFLTYLTQLPQDFREEILNLTTRDMTLDTLIIKLKNPEGYSNCVETVSGNLNLILKNPENQAILDKRVALSRDVIRQIILKYRGKKLNPVGIDLSKAIPNNLAAPLLANLKIESSDEFIDLLLNLPASEYETFIRHCQFNLKWRKVPSSVLDLLTEEQNVSLLQAFIQNPAKIPPESLLIALIDLIVSTTNIELLIKCLTTWNFGKEMITILQKLNNEVKTDLLLKFIQNPGNIPDESMLIPLIHASNEDLLVKCLMTWDFEHTQTFSWLLQLIYNGNVQGLSQIMEHKPHLINLEYRNQTLLHIACENEQIAVVKCLFEKGINPWKKTDHRLRPIDIARDLSFTYDQDNDDACDKNSILQVFFDYGYYDRKEAVRLLETTPIENYESIAKGIDPADFHKLVDNFGLSEEQFEGFVQAFSPRFDQLTKKDGIFLLSTYYLPLENKDLLLQIIKACKIKMSKILGAINKGANRALLELIIENPEFPSENLLHSSCYHSYVSLTRMLLKDKQFQDKINEKDTSNKTPLEIACDKKNIALIKCLIEQGADLNILSTKKKEPLLVYVIKRLSKDDLAELILSCLNNPQKLSKYTAFKLLPHISDETTLEKALNTWPINLDNLGLFAKSLINDEHDAFLDRALSVRPDLLQYQDFKNNSLLHYACANGAIDFDGDISSIRILLKHGADLNLLNKANETPLLYGLWQRKNKTCTKIYFHAIVDEFKTIDFCLCAEYLIQRQASEYESCFGDAFIDLTSVYKFIEHKLNPEQCDSLTLLLLKNPEKIGEHEIEILLQMNSNPMTIISILNTGKVSNELFSNFLDCHIYLVLDGYRDKSLELVQYFCEHRKELISSHPKYESLKKIISEYTLSLEKAALEKANQLSQSNNNQGFWTSNQHRRKYYSWDSDSDSDLNSSDSEDRRPQ